MRKHRLLMILLIMLMMTGYTASVLAEKKTTADIPMKVTITAVCDDYNHVGHEWLYDFTINGHHIDSDETIKPVNKKDKGGRVQISLTQVFRADEKIKINASITECDQYPEFGTVEPEQWMPTSAEWKKGFSIEQSLSVIENKGRYKDCVAKWQITFQFSPMNN